MTNTTGTALVIAKCRKGHSVQGTWEDVRGGWLHCPCGSVGIAKGLQVIVREEKTCGGRCTSAFGPSCDCSCGGKNHGADRRF